MSQKDHKTSSKSPSVGERSVPTPKSGFSIGKQTVLTLGMGFVCMFLLSMPVYETWNTQQIKRYYKDLKLQKKKMAIETRWEERHGYDYLIPKYIASQMTDSSKVFLVPPGAYLKEKGIGGNWVDPRWMYYMTEKKMKLKFFRASVMDSVDYTLMATENGGVQWVELQDSAFRNAVKTTFLPYLTK